MAALIVVLYHYLLSFYPGLFLFKPEYFHTNDHIEQDISETPFNIFFSAGFAVCLFFVISGYALSYHYFVSKNMEYLRSSVIRRYFRLDIPVLFSVIISYILLKSQLYCNTYTAINFTKNTFWFSAMWNMQPDFFKMLKEGLYSSIFTGGTLPYNPVLWTISIEFAGSMLVFVVLALFGNSNKRFIVYAFLIILLHGNYIPAFIIGLALCDYFHDEQRMRPSKILTGIVFLLAIYTGSYRSLEIPNIWTPIDFISHADRTFPFIIGAALFMYVVINSGWLKQFFGLFILQVLGKISFSMYLIHLLILGSVSCYLFTYLISELHLSYGASFGIMFLLSQGIIFLTSFVMYKYIDLSGIKLSKWIYKKIFGDKQLESTTEIE